MTHAFPTRRSSDRTESTSNEANRTRTRASEVAMAAQQSSAAMLDAARTAAGLAQSITLVEHEIDSTDMIFAQAAAQSAEAVENSRQLSDEVQSIESILGDRKSTRLNSSH